MLLSLHTVSSISMEEMTTPETHNWKYLCWISSNIIKTLYDQTLGMHKKKYHWRQNYSSKFLFFNKMIRKCEHLPDSSNFIYQYLSNSTQHKISVSNRNESYMKGQWSVVIEGIHTLHPCKRDVKVQLEKKKSLIWQ